MVKKKNYTFVGESNLTTLIRSGRHLCNCQARIHPLVRNCLSCGRIVCQQEGSGPCFYCGNLVCTREERQILEKRDQKALELLRKLLNKQDLQNFDALKNPTEFDQPAVSLNSIAESIQNANAYKQKLLIADKDQEITKVNDLQADYFSLELNPYLTSKEREAIVKRKEELRQLALQAKRNFLVDVDVTTGAISEQQKREQIESVNDPVLQSILVNSMAKNLHGVNIEEQKEDVENGSLIDKFKPEYREEASRSAMKPREVFASIRPQLEGISLKNTNKLYCFGLKQPLARDLANSKISSIPWNDYVDFQGPVLIAALDEEVETTKCSGTYELQGPSTSSTVEEPPTLRAIVGRAVLRECITWKEFQREGFADAKKFHTSKGSSQPFVLIFETQEPLAMPIPYVCPSEFFEVDKQMIQAINATLITGGGILEPLADVFN